MAGGGDCGLALDLAPELAGSVMGVGNMVGNVGAVIATQLVSMNRNPHVSLDVIADSYDTISSFDADD